MLLNTDFRDDLLKVVITYFDKNYRAISNPNGQSMGGAHTINTGLTHSGLFHYIWHEIGGGHAWITGASI
jgi:predicted alpha/beta superfamily hydrolase